MVSVVNVVGAGNLGVELNLSTLQEDISGSEVNYDAENYPGLHVRLEPDAPMVTLYRTGAYHITGSESEVELMDTQQLLLERLRELGVEVSGDAGFSVRNVVSVADVEEDLNLNAIAIKFGLEIVEYEPEQFPGLVYRPEEFDVVFLIFGSGKVVITGSPGLSESEAAFESLKEELDCI